MSLQTGSSLSYQINVTQSKSGSGEKEQNTSLKESGTSSTSENQNSYNQGSDKMVYAGQVSSTHCEGMSGQAPGSSQLNTLQNSANTQQNPSVQKLLEVILQSLHSKQLENKQLRERCAHLELKIQMDSYEKKDPPRSGREPVSRSKSAPESFQKRIIGQANDVRKSSSPEIFVFPDTKRKLDQNTAPDKESIAKGRISDPVSEDGLKDSLENSDIVSPGEDLKDSFQEPPGVSAQYFNNVISELMRTKTYLHSLQLKQKCYKCESTCENQMQKMRNEIKQLGLKNLQLQSDLAAKEKEMAQLILKSAPIRDESFELSAESEAELSESSKDDSSQSAQVSAELEIQRLREENEVLNDEKHMIMHEKEELQNMLMKDNHEINRELIQLNDAYDKLKEDVKILHTCLQEEKVRGKNTDEKLRTKTAETRKISAQLGSLRQQYEELRQEKNALEKSRSLEDTPSIRFTSPRSQIGGSSEFIRSGGSSRSGEYGRYGSNRSIYSPMNSKSGTFDSYNIRPEHRAPRLAQNDLSTVDNETKLSNLQQFSAASSQKYICPRCLRKFQVENSFQLHLQSCID